MTEPEDRAGSDEPRVGDRLGSLVPGGEDRRARIALWALTLALLAGLASFAWQFAGTLVLGLFAYYVTRPVFERVHERIENRTLAVVVSLLTIALPVLLLVAWTLVIAVQALADFLDEETMARLEGILGPYVDLSTVFADGQGAIQSLLADPTRLQSVDLGAFASGTLTTVLASVGVVAGAALQAFIVLVIAFYLLRDDHRIAAWARRTFAPAGGVVETYLVRVDRELKSVFFGNILNALFTGLLAVVTFLVLNAFAPGVVAIPQPALLGLLVGAASLVPAVGIKLVTVPIGAYLLGRSAILDPSTLWFPLVFFVVSFVVVDYIPDQLLRPYVSGRNLHVGAVMLAYLFGPLLFGWYGIFLGPLLLVVVFEFAQVVLPWLLAPEDAAVATTTHPGGTGDPADDADASESGEPAADGRADEADEFGPVGSEGSVDRRPGSSARGGEGSDGRRPGRDDDVHET